MKSLLTTAGTTLLIVAFAFISGVAIARLFGPDERGIIATATLWPALIAVVADWGTPVHFARNTANSKESVRELIYTISPISVASLALLPTVAIALYVSQGSSFLVMSCIAVLVYAPSQIGARLFGAISQGTGNYFHYNMVKLVMPAMWSISSILLLIFNLRSIPLALIAFSISSLSSLAAAATPFKQYVRRPRFADAKDAVHLVKVSISSHIGNLAPVDTLKLDLAGVGLFLSNLATGLYAVASATSYFMRVPGHIVGVVALPSIARKAEISECSKSVRSAFWVVLLSTTVCVIVYEAFLPLLIRIAYGNDYSPGITAARILSIGMGMAGIRQVLGDCLRGIGSGSSASKAELTGWMFLSVTFPILVFNYGVVGAALATSAFYAVVLVLTFHETLRVFQITPGFMMALNPSETISWIRVPETLTTVNPDSSGR
jgi:O-antigen/teichoic acid export membrane protein